MIPKANATNVFKILIERVPLLTFVTFTSLFKLFTNKDPRPKARGENRRTVSTILLVVWK